MNPMERASHPSREQVEALIEHLEEHPNLAQGFPKAPSARDECREAWKGLTIKLNSLKGAKAKKTLKQWMKYWADKKSAVKKKWSLRSKARNDGGGGESVVDLSEVEERIVALLRSVESSFSGDYHSETNPFPEPPSTSPILLPDNDNLIIIPSYIEEQQESPTPSVICVDVLLPKAEVIPSPQEDPTSPRTRSPRRIELTTPSGSGKYPGRRRLNLSSVQAHSTSSGSQRSRYRRESGSQEQSKFFYLTEQMVKLEKQRMELEQRNSERQAESNLATAKALSAIGEGLKLLAEALNKMTQ